MIAIRMKVLLGVFLVAIIALASITLLIFRQVTSLQDEKTFLANQNSNLAGQLDIVKTQNSELQRDNDELQNEVKGLQGSIKELENQTNLLDDKNAALQNETELLRWQISELQSQINKNRNIEGNKTYEAKIYNFSSSGPDFLVLSVSGYSFSLTIQNTGNTRITNATLETRLTLSDGESPEGYSAIPPINLEVGESIQIYGWAEVKNFSFNLVQAGVHATWWFTLKIPEIVLAKQAWFK